MYSRKIANLAESLNEENIRAGATQTIQDLIEEVRLVPENGTLKIELFGQLAALISLTNKNPRSKETGAQVTLVAGARNTLYRTHITWPKTNTTKPTA